MNRFTAQLDDLCTLPTDPEAKFWYSMAIMDIRIALSHGGDIPNENWAAFQELYEALKKRYEQARS